MCCVIILDLIVFVTVIPSDTATYSPLLLLSLSLSLCLVEELIQALRVAYKCDKHMQLVVSERSRPAPGLGARAPVAGVRVSETQRERDSDEIFSL